MAGIIILLNKADIVTTKVGEHYQINTLNGISINFTPDALKEFIDDLNGIDKAKEEFEKPVKPKFTNCPECHGNGYIDDVKCIKCKGKGVIK